MCEGIPNFSILEEWGSIDRVLITRFQGIRPLPTLHKTWGDSLHSLFGVRGNGMAKLSSNDTKPERPRP